MKNYSIRYRYVDQTTIDFHKNIAMQGLKFVPQTKPKIKVLPPSKLGHIETMRVKARNKDDARYQFHKWFDQFPNSGRRRITAIKLRKK
jgi:hypothetical protein